MRPGRVASACIVAGLLARPGASFAELPDPPASSGLDHIVVVMMENRSFDHFLGWLEHTQDQVYPDRNDAPRPTHHLTDFQGCGHPDPDHSAAGGLLEWDGGKNDGWLRAGQNDKFTIGYYEDTDLPFLAGASKAWTVLDRYFAAIMAPTLPNRFYAHSGRTDRLDDSYFISHLPTIWDRLAKKHISRRYYFSDLPFLALWGLKYLSIMQPYAEFLVDAASGRLPAVSYVDPRFFGENAGVSADYAPHSDIRAGDFFLDLTYEAIVNSPAWPSTVLIVTFDEWGGFFDHVDPSQWPAPDDAAPPTPTGTTLRGFRVPAILISPFAPRGHVSSAVYDHASILRMIEWRFGLAPLATRDAAANNLADELDFDRSHRDTTAPHFAVPPFLFSPPCP